MVDDYIEELYSHSQCKNMFIPLELKYNCEGEDGDCSWPEVNAYV